ncbi:glutamate racemase [Hydrogenophaga sp.]|uniref:glutamate racemase n=1 Tax=Hydrogenophaga sp. TaxID=1904254 RepID=UPI00356541B3
MPTIGVFDSGVGGLSVLRALLSALPGAHHIYLADSAYAPYGERSAADVLQRSQRIVRHLRQIQPLDALVVACNTATALAIDELRLCFPDLPIIGVEPALKPAAECSASGHVGVLATRATLGSARFAQLRQRMEASSTRPLHFSCQPCDGLADAIERDDETQTQALCERYVQALAQVPGPLPPMDTLVLGCTHYPFAAPTLQTLCGPGVALVETGPAVARRTRAVLGAALPETDGHTQHAPMLLTTGSAEKLGATASRWLDTALSAQTVTI